MIETIHRPATVGEILVEEFMAPLGLTQDQLAAAMGVPRKHVNELCRNRRAVTVQTAMLLAAALDTSVEFWLNTQLRNDLWEAKHDPAVVERVGKARSIRSLAA